MKIYCIDDSIFVVVTSLSHRFLPYTFIHKLSFIFAGNYHLQIRHCQNNAALVAECGTKARMIFVCNILSRLIFYMLLPSDKVLSLCKFGYSRCTSVLLQYILYILPVSEKSILRSSHGNLSY